jgi:hypothetical protein
VKIKATVLKPGGSLQIELQPSVYSQCVGTLRPRAPKNCARQPIGRSILLNIGKKRALDWIHDTHPFGITQLPPVLKLLDSFLGPSKCWRSGSQQHGSDGFAHLQYCDIWRMPYLNIANTITLQHSPCRAWRMRRRHGVDGR